jgi:hypothetical protein
MDFLKAEQLSAAKWRVLAIPYGGPFQGQGSRRRVLFQEHRHQARLVRPPAARLAPQPRQRDEGRPGHRHGRRPRGGRRRLVGDGLARPQPPLLAAGQRAPEAGKIYGSSGSLPNFVRTDAKTGEILVWPYIEQTLTPTPANPYSRVVAAKAVDHFDEARIGLSPALRGILSDLDSPTADLRPDLSTSGEPPVAQPGGDLGTGGDDAAIQRLVGAVAQLEELIKNL